MLTRTRSSSRPGDVIGVLDIGTSKTVCLIVAPPNSRANGLWRRERPSVLGFGLRPSRGLKAGVVIDLDGAEQALRSAVSQAEQAAGLTVEEVFVAVMGGRLKSLTFEAETKVADRIVSDADSERLAAAGRSYAERDGHTLLHLAEIGYRLDGAGGVANPRGMAGTLLAADFHAVTVEDAPLRNLLQVVERSFLTPAGIVPAPHASGLAATTEEERRLGVTCIDLGAGSTTWSMFADGHLLSVDSVAVGGHHVTFDIARSLATPFAEAERIKTLHGSLEEGASEDEELFSYAVSGRGEPVLHETTKADLNGIIAGRVSDLIAQVTERVERSGVAHLAAQRVVLTGGGSQLKGLVLFAEEMLGRPVRIGRPEPAAGMSVAYCNPLFSTAMGLIPIALDPAARLRGSGVRDDVVAGGYLKRVGQWLREGF
ncbi:MAG TPA: cell division protein FtsA [Hyphomicrobiaceae bacterium]